MNNLRWIEEDLRIRLHKKTIDPETKQNLTWLPDLLQISRNAGQILLNAHGTPQQVSIKKNTSPVTDVDKRAEAFILGKLAHLTPKIPILSEEAPIPEFFLRRNWNIFWLVDALDGTKEYIAGRDDYTVNIALIEDGKPCIGIIYVPSMQTFYFAIQGLGSWRIGEQQNFVERIYSVCPTLQTPLVVVESRSHSNPQVEEYLRDKKVKERIKLGSSLKFCLLAEGKAHVYPRFCPTMEWDVGAGDCIFRNSARIGSRSSPFHYNKETLKNEPFVLGLEF